MWVVLYFGGGILFTSYLIFQILILKYHWHSPVSHPISFFKVYLAKLEPSQSPYQFRAKDMAFRKYKDPKWVKVFFGG